MKTRGNSVLRLATPVRAWAQRFALALMLCTAFGLMLMSRSDTAGVERLRMTVADAVAPILGLMAEPVSTVTRMVQSIGALGDIYAQNEELRQENERLLQWLDAAKALQQENASLRQLLNLSAPATPRYVTTRIIGDNGGAFVRTVLVSSGAREGVRKNQAAIAGEGLAGRVIEVGERAARVLLLTDINSRVPVALENSRVRAVLAGDNGPMPQLVHLPPDTVPEIGERVVTSGFGGLFPPGIPVGTVAHASPEGVQVLPLVAWDRIEFLRLVDYEAADLAGLLPENAVGAPR
ncbi:MAG TPA: rod shape-determining protein MreC [Alphaproteobacteria bacterium]|nr:rod shape-determining protein MreC [Alphaproteobacteria bacterium]